MKLIARIVRWIGNLIVGCVMILPAISIPLYVFGDWSPVDTFKHVICDF